MAVWQCLSFGPIHENQLDYGPYTEAYLYAKLGGRQELFSQIACA